MASDITPAPARRRITAASVDLAIFHVLTAPIWLPELRRQMRESKARREELKRQSAESGPMCPVPQKHDEVVDFWVKAMVMPRKPWQGDWRNWSLFAISNVLEQGQVLLYGRTVGQRVVGLRTVRTSDGTSPGWDMVARWACLAIVTKTMPCAWTCATVPVQIAWMVLRPRRPWRNAVLGVVVIEDRPPSHRLRTFRRQARGWGPGRGVR